MAKKIKCGDCRIWHGGFHLCVGKVEIPAYSGLGRFRTLGEKANTHLESVREQNAPRDAKILAMYNAGERVADIEIACGVSRNTIQNTVKRLGGVMRGKNWQPEGWEPFNKKEKSNV